MDASQPTYFLTHWVRERGRWTLEEAVRRLTSDTAELFGIADRGRLVPGAFADLNVIDLERLTLHQPEFVHDFPGGAGRWVQGRTATTTRSSTARSSWTTASTRARSPAASSAPRTERSLNLPPSRCSSVRRPSDNPCRPSTALAATARPRPTSTAPARPA